MNKKILLSSLILALVATSCCHKHGYAYVRKLDAVSGATRTGSFKCANYPKNQAVQKVADFLANSGPFFFATADHCQPRVRPIGITMHYDHKIWFHVGKHKDSYRQLKENPNVELVSISKDGKSWIRITGRAVPQDNPEVDKATFEKAPSLKKIYNEESKLTLGHFYISNGTAEIAEGDNITRFDF